MWTNLLTSSGFGFIKISANVVARQHELALTLGIFISIPFSWYPTAHADNTRRTHPVLLNLLVLKPSTNQSLEGKDGVGRAAELTTACRLAGRPTRCSPCFVKATTDGFACAPSAFSIIVSQIFSKNKKRYSHTLSSNLRLSTRWHNVVLILAIGPWWYHSTWSCREGSGHDK